MGVAVLDEDKMLQAEVVHASFAVAADRGEGCGALHLDEVMDRTSELPTQNMRVGVVVKGVAGRRGHRVHLMRIFESV
jgi:hypothetical protein